MKEKAAEPLYNLDAYEIQQYQQNRYPCFFVDRITEAVPGKYARGYKNFTFNEWFFPAHFMDEPNVPGFVQLETMAQVFIMSFLTLPGNKGKKTAFISINNTRFRRKIVPGDRLDLEAVLDFYRHGLAKGHVEGYVCGEIACSSELEVAVPDVMTKLIPHSADGGVKHNILDFEDAKKAYRTGLLVLTDGEEARYAG